MSRIGLVLGAGGVTGGAFHAGTLRALEEATGWDPRTAAVIVGTSAGSLTGALLRAGIPTRDLYAGAIDAPLSAEWQPRMARLQRSRAAWPPVPESGGRLRLGDPRVLVSAARHPWRVRPSAVAASLLPPGRMPTTMISEGIGELFDRWPDEPLWICAVRMRDGRRVVFGRGRAPDATVGQAVAASCAIPAWFAPVTIAGLRYIDGGAHSPTNLDLLRRLDLDLVIVSSPMSVAGRGITTSPDAVARRYFRTTLNAEAIAVRRNGIPVVALQPTAGDRAVMGMNPMDMTRRRATAEQIRHSTLERLTREDMRARLAPLGAPRS